jgi:hypothetical protein
VRKQLYLALLAGFLSLTLPAAENPSPWLSSKLDDLELKARLVRDPEEIRSLVGSDMDGEYLLVEVELRPLYNTLVTLSRSDFLLRSYSDNNRSDAQSPDRIAGPSVLVRGKGKMRQGGNVFTDSNDSVIIGGAPGTGSKPRRIGSPDNSGIGGSTTSTSTVDIKAKDDKGAGTSLLDQLEKIELPMGETRGPVRGYLYFQMSPKYKPKKLGFFYDGTAGECKIRFQ